MNDENKLIEDPILKQIQEESPVDNIVDEIANTPDTRTEQELLLDELRIGREKSNRDIEEAAKKEKWANIISQLGKYGAQWAAANVGSATGIDTRLRNQPTPMKFSGAADRVANAAKSSRQELLEEFKRLQDKNKIKKEERKYETDTPDIVKYQQQSAINAGLSPDAFSGMTRAEVNRNAELQGKLAIVRENKADRREDRVIKQAEKQSIREEKRIDKEEKKQEKFSKDIQERTIPGIGLAQTKDDAKKLKDLQGQKEEFDRTLGEMIELRSKHGGELFNREAVGRGKQLSKKLLLGYKDLAKLGVLSKSDEDILNAIIPSDPLGFTPSSAVGQDPIIHRLKKFKEDIEKDYQTKLRVRLEKPVKQVVQPRRVKVKGIIYNVASDGTLTPIK